MDLPCEVLAAVVVDVEVELARVTRPPPNPVIGIAVVVVPLFCLPTLLMMTIMMPPPAARRSLLYVGVECCCCLLFVLGESNIGRQTPFSTFSLDLKADLFYFLFYLLLNVFLLACFINFIFLFFIYFINMDSYGFNRLNNEKLRIRNERN